MLVYSKKWYYSFHIFALLLLFICIIYEKGIKPHAIGYQEWIGYFEGNISKSEVIEEIQPQLTSKPKIKRSKMEY